VILRPTIYRKEHQRSDSFTSQPQRAGWNIITGDRVRDQQVPRRKPPDGSRQTDLPPYKLDNCHPEPPSITVYSTTYYGSTILTFIDKIWSLPESPRPENMYNFILRHIYKI